MVIRTAAKKAPAKTAAPAPKPAARPAPKAAPAAKAAPAKAPAPKAPAAPKVTAYDVARAWKAANIARAKAELIERDFWAQNEAELDAAVAHAEETLKETTPAPRTGRKPNETPSSKVRAKNPVIGEFYDKDETEQLPLKDLRILATDLASRGIITATKMKKDILAQMEAAGLFRSAGDAGVDEDDPADDDEDVEADEEELDDDADEDEEDEESDDDDEDDEDDADDSDESDDDDESDEEPDDDEDGYTVEQLKGMRLKEIQGIAEQAGVNWDGLSKSALIEALIAASEDEAEGAEPEDEDEEEEGEVYEIDFSELPGMTLEELLSIADDAEIEIPKLKRKNKKAIIELIMAAAEDDEDEDE